jgi:pimeloyl-ACP methyl ester carboxylesterase
VNATTEPTAHDLSIRGVRVRYYEMGSGPPLVLVHGWLVNSKEWSLVIPGLAKRFRVIAPDLPGFGESDYPTEFRYDREGYAETLCNLLAGLEIPRAHVAGHSFGGAVSIVFAADYPERVDRLALINTISYPFNVPLSGRIALFPVVGPFLFKRLYSRSVFHDYFKRSVFAPGFKYDRAMVDAYYDRFSPPAARDAAYRVLPVTTDLTSLGPKISKVRAPTLILWGEQDPMFPVALGTRLSREITGSQLKTLAGCGHAPPEEMPERTIEMLEHHFSNGATA